MHNKVETILGDFTALSQPLGGRPKLAFRQSPHLNPILTSNKKQLNSNTDMEPDIYVTSTFTPTAPLQAPKTSHCHCFICNIIHAIICQQCPMNSVKDKQARLCTKKLIDISLTSDSKGPSNNRTFHLTRNTPLQISK